jgi:cellulose synthase (UDP-forming)
MRFAEFLRAGLPAAVTGMGIYLFTQRWLCHPGVERGLHWRGMLLKLASWPVYMLGTLLAVLRVEVRYIPTPKVAVRGRFLRLAWPHLLVLAGFIATVARTCYLRLVIAPEGALVLTSEAVWGMAAFATLGVTGSLAGVYAAWRACTAESCEPWQQTGLAGALAPETAVRAGAGSERLFALGSQG